MADIDMRRNWAVTKDIDQAVNEPSFPLVTEASISATSFAAGPNEAPIVGDAPGEDVIFGVPTNVGVSFQEPRKLALNVPPTTVIPREARKRRTTATLTQRREGVCGFIEYQWKLGVDRDSLREHFDYLCRNRSATPSVLITREGFTASIIA